MTTIDRVMLAALLRAKEQYGDLNVALVAYWVAVNGAAPIKRIAADLGVSRNMVRRAMVVVSKSDTPD